MNFAVSLQSTSWVRVYSRSTLILTNIVPVGYWYVIGCHHTVPFAFNSVFWESLREFVVKVFRISDEVNSSACLISCFAANVLKVKFGLCNFFSVLTASHHTSQCFTPLPSCFIIHLSFLLRPQQARELPRVMNANNRRLTYLLLHGMLQRFHHHLQSSQETLTTYYDKQPSQYQLRL